MSPDEGVLTLGWGKSGHIMEGVGCILYYIIFKDLFFLFCSWILKTEMSTYLDKKMKLSIKVRNIVKAFVKKNTQKGLLIEK